MWVHVITKPELTVLSIKYSFYVGSKKPSAYFIFTNVEEKMNYIFDIFSEITR